MKFEDLTEQDKDIFLNKEYKPVSELFGEDIPNWHYCDFYVDSNKKKEIFVSDMNMLHKFPIRSHAYIFRWKMPNAPCIYTLEQEYDDVALKAHIFRFTVGGRGIMYDEDFIKKVAHGEIDVDKEFLFDLNKQMDKTFTFKAWKIPFIHVTVDEYNFNDAWSVYEGSEMVKIANLEKDLLAKQEIKKTEILNSAKDTILKFPHYLSIIRSTVQGKISIEEAVQAAGKPDIIVKGF